MSVQEKREDERTQRRKEVVSKDCRIWRKEITQFAEEN